MRKLKSDPTFNPNSVVPTYGAVLAEKLRDLANISDKPLAVEGTRIRHSWAGKCGRALSYELRGLPATDPFDAPAAMSLRLGTFLHEAWQEAFLERWPDGQIEVKAATEGGLTSCHIDAVDGTTCIEVKSQNGFGFKQIAEQGQGPRHSALLQGALNAYAIDADRLVIIYLSLEAVSKFRATQKGIPELQRIVAEFHYSRDEYLPLALGELMRMRDVVDRVDAGMPVPRMIPDPEIPDGAEVVDPASGRWELTDRTDPFNPVVVDTGSTWMCNYCSHQKRCSDDA